MATVLPPSCLPQIRVKCTEEAYLVGNAAFRHLPASFHPHLRLPNPSSPHQGHYPRHLSASTNQQASGTLLDPSGLPEVAGELPSPAGLGTA